MQQIDIPKSEFDSHSYSFKQSASEKNLSGDIRGLFYYNLLRNNKKANK